MCAVSYIGDYWTTTFPQRYPNFGTPITVPMNPYPATGVGGIPMMYVTQEQFNALRQEVAELKELLLAAKKFDEATGQHECHMEEKVELIRKIATMVGIDMKDVFPNGNTD